MENIVLSHAPFKLEPSWQKALAKELQEPYFTSLIAFLEQEYAGSNDIYPPKEHVFDAFWKTPFSKVRVVIVGQDPYHGKGLAHGLCFSVPRGIKPPPSLKNIFKELGSDVGILPPKHGCLDSWAEQGVFLLNAFMTVKDAHPMSHSKIGWERFTDAVIAALAQKKEPIIFVLWGKFAQDKCGHIVSDSHPILKAAHPSPFSAHQGFLGCRHFSKINEFLMKQHQKPIGWSLN